MKDTKDPYDKPGKDWKYEKSKDIENYEIYEDELEIYNSEYEIFKENKKNGIKTDRPKKPKEPEQLPYKDYQIEDRLDEIENPPPRRL